MDSTIATTVQHLCASGQYDQVDRLLDQQPPEALIYNLRGINAVMRGNVQGAIEWIGRAVEAEPHSVVYLGNLGGTLIVAHRYGEAIPLLEKACRLAPMMTTHKKNLALAWFKVGSIEKALPYLQAVVEVDVINMTQCPFPQTRVWLHAL